MAFDEKSDQKLKLVFKDVAQKWERLAQDFYDLHEVRIKVVCGMRTFAEQWAEWGKGRLKDKDGSWLICDLKKVVTYAKPGQSYHQYGLAIDSAFMGADPYLERINKKESEFLWSEYGKLAKKNGFVWGGDWKRPDRPHIELSFGMSYNDLQICYENLGIKGVWAKCEAFNKCGSLV